MAVVEAGAELGYRGADRPVLPHRRRSRDRRRGGACRPRRRSGRDHDRRRLQGLPSGRARGAAAEHQTQGRAHHARHRPELHHPRSASPSTPAPISAAAKPTVGDNGNFLAYTHIAHDCVIGNNVTFANAATLAGHCDIGDHVNHRRADGAASVRADRRQCLRGRLFGRARRRHPLRHGGGQSRQAARAEHHRHETFGTVAGGNPRRAQGLSDDLRPQPAARPEPRAAPGSNSPSSSWSARSSISWRSAANASSPFQPPARSAMTVRMTRTDGALIQPSKGRPDRPDRGQRPFAGRGRRRAGARRHAAFGDRHRWRDPLAGALTTASSRSSCRSKPSASCCRCSSGSASRMW